MLFRSLFCPSCATKCCDPTHREVSSLAVQLGEKPILNLGEFHRCGALLVIIRHAIDQRAHRKAPHQAGIVGPQHFGRRSNILLHGVAKLGGILSRLTSLFEFLLPLHTNRKGEPMRKLIPTVLLCLLPLPASSQEKQPSDNPLSAFTKRVYGFQKGILLRSAEKMPEENYSFKPVDNKDKG